MRRQAFHLSTPLNNRLKNVTETLYYEREIKLTKDTIIENLRKEHVGDAMCETTKTSPLYTVNSVEFEELKSEIEILKDENRNYKLRVSIIV